MVANKTLLSLITSHPLDVLCLLIVAPLSLLQKKYQHRRNGTLWNVATIATITGIQGLLYYNERYTALLYTFPIIILFRRLCVLAITGGIGSGKSTLARILADNGYVVIDCDAINRELLLPGSPAYASIIKKFGAGIILENGEIDRQQLREIVFNNEARRLELNKILHKYIGIRVIWNIFKYRILFWKSRVVLDVPLLYNTPLTVISSPIVVLISPVETRLERLMERDGSIPRSTLQNIIAAQVPDAILKVWGDVVLDNSSSREVFLEKAESLVTNLC
ncbi:Dephospho-CoA kinase family protein [Babesia bovis T2Bo]|uniref:Dephospho-CoA kinase family protein n=1 Tax=Babesia bovis T2Bo TaxID=484906 RepID=UPI001DF9936B|nr:Dephospho-CoA kinase family protein [Babesia bovis T2Bo]EDO07312.2 Dephospho-CoA kinase family protein [Babesia bovis T2Bo]